MHVSTGILLTIRFSLIIFYQLKYILFVTFHGLCMFTLGGFVLTDDLHLLSSIYSSILQVKLFLHRKDSIPKHILSSQLLHWLSFKLSVS